MRCLGKSWRMWGTIARGVPPSRAMRGQRAEFSCTGSRVFAMRIMKMICLYYWTLLTRPEFVEVVRKVREAAGVIMSTLSVKFLPTE